MNRADFLRMALLGGIASTQSFKMSSMLKDMYHWPDLGFEMPVMFVGHGAPNVAAEANEYTQAWAKMSEGIPKPKAILCISAHWLTHGETRVCSAIHPETIYDFGGMDSRLYSMKYPAPGAPNLAHFIKDEIQTAPIVLDDHWGFDHGTWCVLYHMFPTADVPVLQLSVDYRKGEEFHYQLGKELAVLRRKGILIVSSGNIVHNLGQAIFDDNAQHEWAVSYDALAKKWLDQRNDNMFLNRLAQGEVGRLAIPTPDHFYPLLYTLGMKHEKDELLFFNEKVNYGSVSMRSMVYGKVS